LNDRNLRVAHQRGCKITISTDAHHTSDMEKMQYGLSQLRRAWLQAGDVLNTRPTAEFLAGLRRPAQN